MARRDEGREWLQATRRIKRLRRSGDVEGLLAELESTVELQAGSPPLTVRAPAAHALGGLRDARAVEPLARRLHDRNESVRISAARALGEIGDRSAIPPLVAAVGPVDELAADLPPDIRWSTGLLRLSRTLSLLQPTTFRTAALASLVRLGAPEAIPALIVCLESDNHWLRRWAARQLAILGAGEAAAPLRLARRRDYPWRRPLYSRAIRTVKRAAAKR